MQELLLGSLGLQVLAYSRQYPWRVFAFVLVGILLLDMVFRTQSRGTGADFDLDFGGDGDGGDGGGGD